MGKKKKPSFSAEKKSAHLLRARKPVSARSSKVSDHPAPWKSEKQASPGNQRRDVLVLTRSIKRSQSHTESGDKAISSFTYPPVACLNSAGLHRTSLLLSGRVHKPEAPESSPRDWTAAAARNLQSSRERRERRERTCAEGHSDRRVLSQQRHSTFLESLLLFSR